MTVVLDCELTAVDAPAMCSGGGLFDLESASAGGNGLLGGAVIATVLCGHGALLVLLLDNGDTLKFGVGAMVV